MARRYLIMSSPNGSSNRVNFYDYKLKLNDPFSEIQYENEDKMYQMRPNVSGPGNRVHKSLGSNINHGTYSFVAHRMIDTEAAALAAMFEARPNVVLFSIDSGSTRYYAKFKDGGLRFEGYRNNEDPSTGKAYFIKAEINLAILMITTQAFS